MDELLMTAWGKFGGAAALCLAAVGSALGAGAAGPAAIGAWKKCYAQGKAAPFTLVTFVGAPLSQTIYGMILMNKIMQIAASAPQSWPLLVSAGVFGGLAMGASAWYQGKAGAAGSDALGETGQGFGNYLMVLGVIETVALFVMVFLLMAVGK
ncbi:MAG TPA: V-type ATP synthase subunit K [Kiritimatiellia bacterium]|nr:V-type ATP synthase subunit K [Kiritimatiellia bacterium]HNS80182.1 V-type ATP synthase subunit K [Kiritimatiellia bacterium]HPA77374.1 V-type ATP synthase subunit K [Kiritimatiellia bacterium]HQQ03878.1 V-type ATP synthase subunit K [Kiritimatiellia bacterium]